jgi:hypothetical protein
MNLFILRPSLKINLYQNESKMDNGDLNRNKNQDNQNQNLKLNKNKNL